MSDSPDIIIEVQNTIYCKILKGRELLRTFLGYRTQTYRPGQYRAIRKEYRKSVITRGGLFHLGHLRGVRKYCKKKKHKLKITNNVKLPKLKYIPPKLKGITLRPDQLRAVKAVHKFSRGQIVAPTGTGKTIVAGAVISSYPDCKALFLAHTKDLVEQTIEEFKSFDIGSVGRATGEGEKDFDRKITVATMQTFVKNIKKHGAKYDMIIIDEGHRISKPKGSYGKILSICPAPIKLSFTATPQQDPEPMMTARGLIGPIIAELTWKEGVELDILARPKLKLVKIPVDLNVKDIRNYQDVYNQGIVYNNARNKAIFKEVKEFIERGESVLLLVTIVEHGKVLSKLGERLLKMKIPFVYGNTPGDIRKKTKTKLMKKEILVVIASVIWNEGVNIPTLNGIINASGGKKEEAVLQKIGRGLRRTKEKDRVTIIDFFDPSHPTLVEHFGTRLCLYFNKGWI